MFTVTAHGVPTARFALLHINFYLHQVPMALKKFTMTARDMPAAYFTVIACKFYSHQVPMAISMFARIL